MSVRGTVEYGAMGVTVTIILYCIFGFAPSLMLSLSIADTLGEWGSEGWASLIWGCAFGALIAVQMALQANIRHTWGIILLWWLLSLYPFFNWFHWFYTSFWKTPFPGIDWMLW